MTKLKNISLLKIIAGSLVSIVIILLTVTVILSSRNDYVFDGAKNQTTTVLVTTTKLSTTLTTITTPKVALTTTKNDSGVIENEAEIFDLDKTESSIPQDARSRQILEANYDVRADRVEYTTEFIPVADVSTGLILERMKMILPTLGPSIIESIIDRYSEIKEEETSVHETTTEDLFDETTILVPETIMAKISQPFNDVTLQSDRCRKYNEATIKKKHSLLYRYPKRYRRCRKRLNYLGKFLSRTILLTDY